MFLFFAIEPGMFLFFPRSEAGDVLSLFLFFEESEPQRSYKHGSYSTNSVYWENLEQTKVQKKAKIAMLDVPSKYGWHNFSLAWKCKQRVLDYQKHMHG